MIEVIESLQKISEKNIFYISNPGEISLSRQGNSESEIFPGMRLIFIIKSLSNKIPAWATQYYYTEYLFNENINKEDKRIYEGIPVYKIESADDNNKIKIGFGSKPQSSPGKYISLSKFDTYVFRKFEVRC